MKSVYIHELFAFHFRNFNTLKIKLDPKNNVFFGRNGHGKTNLLEAICLASSFKSIRPAKNRDLILFDQERSRIKANIGGHDHFNVEIDIFLQGKKGKISENPVESVSAINRKLAVITFVPDDLHIVSGSGAFRRNLLNQTGTGLFPVYTALHRRFEQALLRRNRLLKTPHVDQQELEAFNQIFVETAASLIKARHAAIDILRPFFKSTLAHISGNSISTDITYESMNTSEQDSEKDIQSILWQKLKTLHSEERLRRITLVGPHLDDLTITMGALAARHTASRGQSRAIVLALKIAQIHCLATTRKITPILLLDDVLGELDKNNAERLLDTIKAIDAQTFITTTQLELLPKSCKNYKAFEIHQGTIKKEN
jgi:DNA replication and repair protein RecF